MPISENEKLAFLKKGRTVEKEFSKLFKDAVPTSEEEDMNMHIDLKINIGVDVKGLKKIKRSDQDVNEHIHWIEIKNVNGKLGWLYGEADFFSFEIKDYWIVVSKLDLQNFIKENVKKERVKSPELYKLYQREERKDIITLLTSYDLSYICTVIIKK